MSPRSVALWGIAYLGVWAVWALAITLTHCGPVFEPLSGEDRAHIGRHIDIVERCKAEGLKAKSESAFDSCLKREGAQ